MEVNSTQDLLSRVDELNAGENLCLKNIDLIEVDRELDDMERDKQVMEERTMEEGTQEDTGSPQQEKQQAGWFIKSWKYEED